MKLKMFKVKAYLNDSQVDRHEQEVNDFLQSKDILQPPQLCACGEDGSLLLVIYKDKEIKREKKA